MKATKLGVRKWLSFIVAGLIGQLAWAIENNYLNVYAYDATGVYNYIPIMTAASAVVATLTTLLMGALSDRLGKRKIFVSAGYIIWGISIILFAFLDPHSSVTFLTNAAFLSGTLIVIMDCVMTFFGSTANDAAFNAFITDNTDESNRGKVESVLSILPLVAMIAIVLLQGMLVDPIKKDWSIFFFIFGGITTLAGIGCLFLLPKDVKAPNKEELYIKNIVYGFKPSVIKAQPKLYLALTAFMVFSIAIQIFMPYFMVYVNKVLVFDMVSTAGPILGVACILTVVFGFFMDKIGKYKVVFGAIGAVVVGGVLLFLLNQQIGVIIGGIILMTGYLLATAVLGTKVRDFTPEKEVGLFQGIRMIFVVMIPMVTGPYIGQCASMINNEMTKGDFGQWSYAPTPYIFLFSAIAVLFVLIPLIILYKKEKQDEQVSS